MENKINKFLEELIQEVEKDLDEATTSGAAGAYSTPNAFSDNGSKDKKKKKKIATQLGMKLVGKVNEGKYNYKADALTAYFKGKLTPQELDTIARDDFKSGIATKKELSSFLSNKFTQDVMSDTYGIPTGTLVKKVRGLMKFAEGVSESVITEKQFKGLDGIDDKTSLTKISDTQKLKIIQGTGNIISFKVPKGSDRNFWQVISKGKIKKTRNPQGYTRYILPGKMISSPFFKSEKDLVNGVDWDSVEKARRFNESLNEAKIQRPVNRWLAIKNDETKHPHKKMAMGLKELKYQLAETQKFFRWYNKIKSMNELDSSDYWKRTQSHIYKIKERLINIAKTIQEIEK